MQVPTSWKNDGKKLVRKITLQNFNDVIKLVNKIAKISNLANHHPDLKIYDFNKITIVLTTHSAGKVTKKDFEVANQIEGAL